VIRPATLAVAAAATLVCAGVAVAQGSAPPPAPHPAVAYSRWTWGGGIGVGLGNVAYVDVSPWIGYRATQRATVGGSLVLRWRQDDRYTPTLTTTDYGGSVFTRYDLFRNVFAQAEYEYLDYEYPDPFGDTQRTGQSSLFLGAGAWFPSGGRVNFGASVLYNVLHDDSDPFRAYDDPWVVRLGVGVGF